MSSSTPPQVDLANCDREPIHLLGRVQPFGFLLGLDANWCISHISENAADFLPRLGPHVIGDQITTIVPHEIIHLIRNRLQHLMSGGGAEVLVDMPLVGAEGRYDLMVHITGGVIIIEAEPSSDADTLQTELGSVRNAVAKAAKRTNVNDIARLAVRFVRLMSGFDRVMFYKFRPDLSGEVVAEDKLREMEPFLNLRYPATDIPAQARKLYVRNTIRIIADVSQRGAQILAAPDARQDLDLSDSTLRAVSEIHLEYLSNMGVGASMSISIVVNGELWGLIACHHNSPKTLSQSKRNSLHLFGQMLSLVIQNQLANDERANDEKVRAITDTLARRAGGTNSRDLLLSEAEKFLPIVQADGLSVIFQGEVQSKGKTPSGEEIALIHKTLQAHGDDQLYHTSAITDLMPEAKDFAQRAAGMLVIPISRTPGDYIVFFRQELVQKVNWAGNPEKPASLGPNGVRLTPRKSFEAWRMTVSGRSEDWTAAQLRAAAQLRVTMLEVVLRLTDEVARERKTANEKQELLIAELNHRVRNILGLVRGLISQSHTGEISTSEFVEMLDSRVQSLARAHDQITKTSWAASSLSDLIRVEAESYLLNKHNRVEITGEDVLITPPAFSVMALVMHEMLTNSAKYGALSDQNGRLVIDLSRSPRGDLAISWKELDGPPVQAPKRRGFGSTIIERTIPFELGGQVDMSFNLSGVEARFDIPSSYVEAGRKIKPGAAPSPEAAPDQQVTGPQHVMIVEDNLIIALEAEDIFNDLGAQTVHVFPNVAEAISHLETMPCDFALLDVNLGRETSLPIAQKLLDMGVRFVFATGYGEAVKLPDNVKDVQKLSKPYGPDSVRALFRG